MIKFKMKKWIKKLIFGEPYTGKLKAGDKVYSEYFKRFLVITKIVSDKVWYFKIEYPNYSMLRDIDEDTELEAKTPLSEMERLSQ